MDLSHHESNGVVVVEVAKGEAVSANAQDFKNRLLEFVENGKRKIAVDFSNVEYIDSSFLGSLVSVLKRITDSDGGVKVFGLAERVRGVFELTRLYKVFDIHDDEESAVKSFNDA
jgi:anti-sigma B factor antagonist